MNVLAQLKATLNERYDIEREIGAGGMATVYLARDLRHDRPVALKVLNPDLGAVLGVERFLAEIKVTANLQHPNLLPLFDSGEAGGLLFYVMPFVQGESLRVRLEREKQLPIDEALRIAIAIASALDYAHQHGVIHRDLKPENILLQAGQPVIADFGIALAVSKAGGNRITQTGLSLGTPQYMSPEQATGDRVIDGRSDIYSLAAMTYEMLAGEAPHTGTTAQAIIARVLTEKPRTLRASRSAVPEYVDAAIERGLEKLPADRFSTPREFAEALQGRGTAAPRPTAARPAGVLPAAVGWRGRLRDPVVLTLAAVSLASIVAATALSRRPAPAEAVPPVRFVIATPDSLRPIDNFPWPAAISPDGGTVAFSVGRPGGSSILYALRTDQLEARPITGTEDAFEPFFSPDGKWLAFEVTGKERKVRLDGSAPVNISAGGGANGADWSVGDEIVLGAVGKYRGLSRVSAAGGELVEFTSPDSAKGDWDYLWPIVLPDGKHVVFTIWSGSLSSSILAITSLGDGKVIPLGVKGIRPLAVLDGRVVYVQADGSVMAVALDAGKQRVTGMPVPVLDPVTVPNGNNGNSGIFVSRGGALVTSRGGSISRMTWVELSGKNQPVFADSRQFSSPSLSPDGRHIAVLVSDGQQRDVWIYDLSTATFSRLTSNGNVGTPSWTADGTRVVFSSSGEHSRNAIWMQLAAGGSPAERLFEHPELMPRAVPSLDGKSLLVEILHAGSSWDVFRVALDSGGVARPYLSTKADEVGPRFSTDGKWVCLVTNESGRNEVYVRSFPDPSSRIQISVDGGTEPVWSRDGKRVYYRSGTALLAANVSSAPFRVLSRDTVLAQVNLVSDFQSTSYDVTPDGKRFVALVPSRDGYQLVVSPNWITEFRRRLAGNSNR